MSVGLPLAAYVFVFFGFRTHGLGWRAAAIGAAVVWGVLVALITELLSLLGGITRANLAIAWLVVDVAAVVYLWEATRQLARPPSLWAFTSAFQQMASRLPLPSRILLSGVAVIMALVGVVAVVSPPNTWDAMAYHMPRVVHWIEQRSIAFYPTPDLRQLHMPPWAEFAMLHVHVLFGSDRLDNLVQWGSFLGSVVGVTLLAQSMGASLRGQALAAVVCATIPQGILAASGAKNDYVVAFWLVAFAYYLCAFRYEPTSPRTFAIGSALGLAWLTKGTAYLFSSAILLAAAVAWPWKAKIQLLKHLPLLMVLALGLNAGHFLRNYHFDGSPLGPSAYGAAGSFKLTNDEITIGTLLSNILRNVSIHLGTPIRTINLTVEKWLKALIHVMGNDANNPATTWSGTAFHVPEMSRHEALAGNPVHLGLIMVTLVLMITCADLRASRPVVVSGVGLVLAFLLFCAFLRWQPWHTRLHLPLFVLGSALVGMVLARAWPGSVTTAVGILLLLLAVPVALGNQLRPLAVGGEPGILRQERRALYFAESRALQHAFRSAAQFVKKRGCEAIGLDFPPDSPIYPLLMLLDAGRGKGHIHYVDVKNTSARYGERGSGAPPCAIICLLCQIMPEKWKEYLSTVGPATAFQPTVVFSANEINSRLDPSARESPECRFRFISGWHGWERGGQGWWRWTDGHGQIRVVVAQDSDVVLHSEVFSLQYPNKVDVVVNGKIIGTWDIMEDISMTLEPLMLHFKAGENNLVFASHNPAKQIPTDSRALALGVKNLLIFGADGATICELQP